MTDIDPFLTELTTRLTPVHPTTQLLAAEKCVHFVINRMSVRACTNDKDGPRRLTLRAHLLGHDQTLGYEYGNLYYSALPRDIRDRVLASLRSAKLPFSSFYWETREIERSLVMEYCLLLAPSPTWEYVLATISAFEEQAVEALETVLGLFEWFHPHEVVAAQIKQEQLSRPSLKDREHHLGVFQEIWRNPEEDMMVFNSNNRLWAGLRGYGLLRISRDDMQGNLHNIRWYPGRNFPTCLGDRGRIIASYNNLEELVDNGWRRDCLI